jgi:hypothetical protein
MVKVVHYMSTSLEYIPSTENGNVSREYIPWIWRSIIRSMVWILNSPPMPHFILV